MYPSFYERSIEKQPESAKISVFGEIKNVKVVRVTNELDNTGKFRLMILTIAIIANCQHNRHYRAGF